MSGADDNAAESTPVLAIALAVIAFLGVSTAFLPSSWFGGDAETAEATIAADGKAGDQAEPAQQVQTDKESRAAKPDKVETAATADAAATEQASPDTTAQPASNSAESVPETHQMVSDESTQAASTTASIDSAANAVMQPSTAAPVAAKPDNSQTNPAEPAKPSVTAPKMPPHQVGWRPPHLAPKHDDSGFSMSISPPVRPRYPQPPQYPGYAYPNPYGYNGYPVPPMPVPASPYARPN